MANKEFFDDRLEHIARLLDTTVLNLNKIKDMIIKLDFDEKRDLYRNVAGVSGTFDGTHMVGEDGKKYEIPANYSAKTRIVYGDVLKMIEEDGKHVFKQITKVPRKKVEGVLTKKEGKWHIISDSGTFRVSDVAAEFYKAELNDEAAAFIPEDNLRAPFAALDRVKKAGEPVEQHAEAPTSIPEKKFEKKETAAPVAKVEATPTVALAEPAETELATPEEAPAPVPMPKPTPVPAAAPKPVNTPKTNTAPVSNQPSPAKPATTSKPAPRNDRNDGGRSSERNDRNDRGDRNDRPASGRDGGPRNDRPPRGRNDNRGGGRDSRGGGDSRGRNPYGGSPAPSGQAPFSRPPRPKKDFSEAPDDTREATTTITSLDDDDLR